MPNEPRSLRTMRNEDGFSLVETLIAALIIAGMLGVVFQVIENGARQSRTLENRRLAILVAQSQLSAIEAIENTSFGEMQGETSGVRWRVEVSPRPSSIASTVKLEDVVVTTAMSDDDRDLFVLRTVRIAQ